MNEALRRDVGEYPDVALGHETLPAPVERFGCDGRARQRVGARDRPRLCTSFSRCECGSGTESRSKSKIRIRKMSKSRIRSMSRIMLRFAYQGRGHPNPNPALTHLPNPNPTLTPLIGLGKLARRVAAGL